LGSITGVLSLVNLFFAIVIGLYFWNLLRAQQTNRSAIDRESKKQMEHLERLRSISLSEPLSEKTRPSRFEDIIGQDDGLKSLRAALCGPNPQHVIIYGPPGIGKTAAARVVLEEAKRNPLSPFRRDAKFVEVDATTARFDDRGIADPLMGSVHDPIYQGAGPMGVAGIPQPKPGAVTKAHGGVLFIDEIGELHPVQMNKLLKVLEDRKVFLESAYYSSEDTNIPRHVHEMFRNGLPADFRLVAATTRRPEEIPPAIRSRCLEVFFKPLTADEVEAIAINAAAKIGFEVDPEGIAVVRKYAANGREAVNLLQVAAGICMAERKTRISARELEWVVNSGQYHPRPERQIEEVGAPGLAYGLGIFGANQGIVMEVEANAIHVPKGTGKLVTTGLIEEEEIGSPVMRLKRRSMARDSVQNVLTVLRRHLGIDYMNYDIHVNFPGGHPVDGPSAGITMACAVYSAITGLAIQTPMAMTGEVSIRGVIKPVGAIPAKIEAARRAGARKVLIPKDNWQELLADCGSVQIVAVSTIEEVIGEAFGAASKSEVKSAST
jgi:Lon-like ATP-dependent protease